MWGGGWLPRPQYPSRSKYQIQSLKPPVAKGKQWHPTLVWPWTSHLNFLCSNFFIWSWAHCSLTSLLAWSCENCEKQFTNDWQWSNKEESWNTKWKVFNLHLQLIWHMPIDFIRSNNVTQRLEWIAWGQTLALTLANSMIWGLRFSSRTRETIIVPILAGLLWGSTENSHEHRAPSLAHSKLSIHVSYRWWK